MGVMGSIYYNHLIHGFMQLVLGWERLVYALSTNEISLPALGIRRKGCDWSIAGSKHSCQLVQLYISELGLCWRQIVNKYIFHV